MYTGKFSRASRKNFVQGGRGRSCPKPSNLTITTTSLASGTVGTAYMVTLSATGGSGTLNWSLASGSLPAGLMLSSSGLISGTPTTAGTSTFTVQVTDSSGSTAMQSLMIVISSSSGAGFGLPAPIALPSGTVGQSYGVTVSGTAPFTFTSGTLPTGLTFSSSGTISGTPTQSGNFGFTITSSTGSQQPYTLAIASSGSTLVISPTNSVLTSGTVGTFYSQSFSASGGSGTYSWTLISGTVPAGLALSSSGSNIILSGTPTSSGTSTFTLQATDQSTGVSATQTYSLTISSSGSTLTIVTGTILPVATVNTFYSQTLTASGGAPSYTWSMVSGSLPTGLSLSSNGVLSGTPTTSGSFTFTVQVVDSVGNSTTKVHQLTVRTSSSGGGTGLTVSPSSVTLPRGQTQILSVTGGTAPYTWSFSGTQPTGVTLSSTAGSSITLAATSTATTGNTTVAVVDSTGSNSATVPVNVTTTSTLVITTTSLAAAQVGSAYSQTLRVSPSSTLVTWSVISGSLPAGLSLSTAGVISGTPTTAGTSNFTVQATSTSTPSQTATQPLSITVNEAVLPTPLTTTNTTTGVLVAIGISLLVILILGLIIWAVYRSRARRAAAAAAGATSTTVVTPGQAPVVSEHHQVYTQGQAPSGYVAVPPPVAGQPPLAPAGQVVVRQPMGFSYTNPRSFPSATVSASTPGVTTYPPGSF